MEATCIMFHRRIYRNCQVRVRNHAVPWWLSGKESPANAGNTGSIPDPRRAHMLQSN